MGGSLLIASTFPFAFIGTNLVIPSALGGCAGTLAGRGFASRVLLGLLGFTCVFVLRWSVLLVTDLPIS